MPERIDGRAAAMSDGWRSRYMAPAYALVISFVLVLLLGFALHEQETGGTTDPGSTTTPPTSSAPTTGSPPHPTRMHR